MDLGSQCSVLESVEDNEVIANDSVWEKLGNISESKFQNSGSGLVENNDSNELFPELKREGTDVSGYVGSPAMVLKPEVSPFSTSTKKGYGLRKWRRIKRDASGDGDSSTDTGKKVAEDLFNSSVNPSKRTQYAERKQKSEGSVSSTKAIVRSLDGFAMLGDLGLCLSLIPPFAIGTDSEKSKDQSSKSSTAASAPKMKYETPVSVGYPRYRSRMRSLSGKNLAHTVQRGQHGKCQTESTKKARGERVKIEKENSHSSKDSDSQSSNFVIVQGNYSVNNGTQNGRPNDYDESDEVVGRGQQVNDGHVGVHGKDSDAGFDDFSHKDVVAGSSWEVREEKSEDHGSTIEHNPLDECCFELQSAHEALEEELLKLREIGNDVSVSDTCTESTSFEQSHDVEGLRSSSQDFQTETFETAIGDEVTELEEDLFKQKVEAEVERLIISRKVQMLRVAAVGQITILKEQLCLASEQTQILDKLGDAENKAAMLKQEAENLEKICEDIVSADEILKLQKKVCKYSSCFLIQLVLLLAILSIFLFQFSISYVEFVPT